MGTTHALTPIALEKLAENYKTQLYQDTIPFWLQHGMDNQYGGILTGLDRDGSILETDKSVWFQGRAAWTFATAYRLNPAAGIKLLEAAQNIALFSEQYCWDSSDERMYFRVTRQGQPLIKRRYIFSECFAAGAQAALAAATGSLEHLNRGFEIFSRVRRFLANPDEQNPKVNPETRPSLGLGLPMILINIAQELREASLILQGPGSLKAAECTQFISQQLAIITKVFYKPDLKCLLEQTGPKGEFDHEHFEGRLINPGHSIEAAWFMLREADFLHHCGSSSPDTQPRGIGGQLGASVLAGSWRASEPKSPQDLITTAVSIIDWMFEAGWDSQYGGLFYFLDALGKPPYEYWHSMKFWWPHNEAVIAALYAAVLTGEDRHLVWFDRIHHWSQNHFPDPQYGEWFGYLNRDTSISTPLKGNMFKGPFHIPRMQMWAWKLLENLAGRKNI